MIAVTATGDTRSRCQDSTARSRAGHASGNGSGLLGHLTQLARDSLGWQARVLATEVGLTTLLDDTLVIAAQAGGEELVKLAAVLDCVPTKGLGCGLEVIDLREDPGADLV